MTPEIFKCARCGNETKRAPGATSQKYCKECARKAHNEWGRKTNPQPVVEFKPPDERCESCAYWVHINGRYSDKCCHYLLDTGKARKRNEEKCLSYSTEREECLQWSGG